jgi:hypothetical protein
VDGSDPTYKERASGFPRNPTNGAVGGWFKSGLRSKAQLGFLNPTNGSWWMVQVQPTKRNALRVTKSHQRQLVDSSSPAYKTQRTQSQQIPPTAVGGWFKSCLLKLAPESAPVLLLPHAPHAFSSLTWAYQLHYYLCFRTHRRNKLFAEKFYADSLTDIVTEYGLCHLSAPRGLYVLAGPSPDRTLAKGGGQARVCLRSASCRIMCI